MIRIATLEDKEAIKEMALKFMEVSGYKEFSTDADIDFVIETLLLSPRAEAVIFIEDGGMIAGRSYKFPFGPHLVATEVAWWVDPDKRKNGLGQQLLTHFEMWAKIAGCSLTTMISLDDELGKFYEKNGYKLYERAYMKVL